MNKIFSKQVSNISDSSERRKVENVYALKSIQLDRVKPMFVEELKNEIEILKVCHFFVNGGKRNALFALF